MAQLIGFDPSIFSEGSRNYGRAVSDIGDTLVGLSRQIQEQKALEEERAYKERLLEEARLREEEKAAMKPEAILAEKLAGREISPEKQAKFDAWQAIRTSEMTTDALGNVIPKYQSIMGMPSTEFKRTPGVMSEDVSPIPSPTAPSGRGEILMEGQQLADVQAPAMAPGLTAADMDSPFARKERVKSQVELEFEQRKAEAEKKASRPMFDKQFAGLQAEYDNISDVIDSAIGQSNWRTTGFIGQQLQDIGGTDALDLRETLKTVQADAAFGRLQEMRDNSPTGGALGQVSERELALLQNARSAIEQAQSEEQLDANLTRYKNIRKGALDRVAEAYKQDFGAYPKGYEPPKKDKNEIPTVSTQADFDALPSGATFIEDGIKYRKP